MLATAQPRVHPSRMRPPLAQPHHVTYRWGMNEPDMKKLDIQELDRKFERPGHLVRRLHQICISIFLQHSADLKLTAVQFATLVAIGDRPGMDQITIGRTIALDRQSVSNVVNRLVAHGLIDKRARDKRAKALYLTQAGRDIIDQMSQRTDEIDATILAPLTASERKTFMSLLGKLVDGNNALSRAPIRENTPDDAST